MAKELWFTKTSDGTRTIVNVDPDPSKQNPFDPSSEFPSGGDFVVQVAGRSAAAVLTIPAPVVSGGTGLSLAYDPTGLFTITPSTGHTPSGVTQTWEAFKNGISIGQVNAVFDPGNLETATGEWYVVETNAFAGYQPQVITSSTLTLEATSPYPWMTSGEWNGAEVPSTPPRITEISTLLDPPEGKVWAAHRKTTTYGAALANDFPGELVVMNYDGTKYSWRDTIQRTAGAAEYCRIAIGDLVDVSGGILTNGVWAVDEKTFTVSNTPLALGSGDWGVVTANNGFTLTLTNPENARGTPITDRILIIDSVEVGPVPGGLAMGSWFIANTATGALSVAIKSVNANGSATSATKSVTPTTVVTPPGQLSIDVGTQQWVFDNVLELVQHVDGVVAVRVAPGQSATWTSKTPAMTGTGVNIRHGQKINPTRENLGYLDGRCGGSTTFTALPATVAIGETVLSGDSRATIVNARHGPVDNQHCFYVTDQAVNPLTLGPPIIFGSKRGPLTVPAVVDYMAKAAALPTTFGVTGWTYKSLSRVNRDLRMNLGQAMTMRDAQPGYEDKMPWRWGHTNVDLSNYNEYGCDDVSEYLLHLIAPLASVPLEVKAAILMRLDSYGWQTQKGHDLISPTPISKSAGGHHQSQCAGIALHHWLRGNDNFMDYLFTQYSGAAGACFRWTQDHLDYWQGPYGSPGSFSGLFDVTAADGVGNTGGRPAYGLRRSVTAVDAANRRVSFLGIVTGSGQRFGDLQKALYQGMILCNETTGEEALITAQFNSTPGSTSGDIFLNTVIRMTVDVWPSLGFSIGDTIYMKPNFTPFLDMPDWRIYTPQDRPNGYVGTDKAKYRQLQRWFQWMIFFRCIGYQFPSWQTAWDYGVAASGTLPAGTQNWPPLWRVTSASLAEALWAEHEAAILAVPQPYL
jgi:hypothetical protein